MTAKALFKKGYGFEKKEKLRTALHIYKQVIDQFPDTKFAQYAERQIEKIQKINESKGGVQKKYSGGVIKAPHSFLFRENVKSIIMAIATCCVIAYIFSRVLPVLSFLFLLLGPFILIAAHVSKGSEGPFELDYRMFLLEQRMNRLLKTVLGRRRYFRLLRYRLFWGTTERRQNYVEILEDPMVKSLSDLRFLLYAKNWGSSYKGNQNRAGRFLVGKGP
jgi:hypothetical protein